MAWEYTTISVPVFNARTEEIQVALNQLGSVGWEVCGVTVLPNVGNQMASATAYLKRERTDPAAPDDESVGWKVDPLKRFRHRWWDGRRWTESVHNGTANAVDFPI